MNFFNPVKFTVERNISLQSWQQSDLLFANESPKKTGSSFEFFLLIILMASGTISGVLYRKQQKHKELTRLQNINKLEKIWKNSFDRRL